MQPPKSHEETVAEPFQHWAELFSALASGATIGLMRRYGLISHQSDSWQSWFIGGLAFAIIFCSVCYFTKQFDWFKKESSIHEAQKGLDFVTGFFAIAVICCLVWVVFT